MRRPPPPFLSRYLISLWAFGIVFDPARRPGIAPQLYSVQSAFSCLVNALWRRRKVLTHNEALPPHFSYLGIINSSLNLLIYLSYLDCLLGEDVGCIVAVVLPGHAHVSPEVIAPPSLQQCMGSRHLDYNIPKDGLPSSGLSCITKHGLPSSGLSFNKV